MGKEYIVQTAVCQCKFGAAPGLLKVTDNKGIYMNGKRVATTKTLGNVFNPPGFGLCKKNPFFPKPCVPAVTQWTDPYDGISVNGGSPLTETSKGTCSQGGPDCVTFQTTGQIAIPGLAQMRQASFMHQIEMNPLGSAEALDEDVKDDTPIVTRVYWKDKDVIHEIDEIPGDGVVTLYAETQNTQVGERFSFMVTDEEERPIAKVENGVVGPDGIVKIGNFDLKNYKKELLCD
jgi:hypothetical protein